MRLKQYVTITVVLSAALFTCSSNKQELIDFECLGYVQPRNSADIEDSYWGIQAGTLDEEILKKAAAIGVKWTRLGASWGSIEKERGKFDWSETDRAFEASLSVGITPFVTLGGSNKLYCPVLDYMDPKRAEIYGRRPAPPTYSKETLNAWLRFVEKTVGRYKDRITYWEVWNEPNHFAYWGDNPSATDYGRLLRETAKVIRKVQPDAKIIGGATAGMNADYIDGYLSVGTENLIDIISYHQYGGEPEERFVKMIDVRQAINKYNPNIETWQGECGYPSASSTRDFRGRAPWGLNIQAKWLLRQALSDVYLCRSTLSNYFKLYSSGDRMDLQPRSFLTKVDSTIGFYAGGLARVRGRGVNEKCLLENPSGKPKPGYYAYQNLCAIIDKSYKPVDVMSTTEVTDAGVFYGIGPWEDAFPSVPLVACFEKDDGSKLLAHWLPWHGQECLPKLAKINLSVKDVTFENPVLVDLLSGKVYKIDDVSEAEGATTFEGLPLADYPMVIVEQSNISIIGKRSFE